MKLVRSDPDTVREKFTLARQELSAALIEREDEIDAVLTALLANEHVLLVGPPGARQEPVARLASLLDRRAEILDSADEVLGARGSLRHGQPPALKEDRFVRVTTGKLPEADYAFVDECFKASSAILNTLLKILNERVYDAGDGIARKVPLKLCVGASNEWPSPETGKELSALFDRFLLRRAVSPIRSQTGQQRLLWTRDHTPRLSSTISPDEVEQARCAAAAVPWTSEAKQAFETILRELSREGIQPGDRRQFKTVGVIQAYAYLCGAESVMPEHLEIAANTLWDDPAEQSQKVVQVIGRIANPTGMRVNQLLLEAEQARGACDVRNLAEAAKTAAKLAEIDRQFGSLKGDARDNWVRDGRGSFANIGKERAGEGRLFLSGEAGILYRERFGRGDRCISKRPSR